jgi:plasmid stabilization system protein ParE
MYSVQLTPSAKRDIDSVIDFIKNELFSPFNAEIFFRGIYGKIKKLEVNAAIFAKSIYRDVLIYGDNARHITYKGFVIIYTIHINRVVVHRIIHGSLIKK